MLTALERSRLMQRIGDEAAIETAIVARCAAGLGVIVLIAAIGSGTTAEPQKGAPVEVRIPPREMVANSAGAHRREVFAQRRQRYSGDGAHAGRAWRPLEILSVAPE